MGKRITIKFRDPNPLFRTWLTQWTTQALMEHRDSLANSLRIALSSLEKYPLPLKAGRDCMILEGFGTKICDMLDKKLVKYRELQKQIKTRVSQQIPVAHNSPVKQKPVEAVVRKPSLSQQSVAKPDVAVPGPSVASKRIRKTKSDQCLPKAPKQPETVKPGTKRKAVAPMETILSEDVIMSPGGFEVILLVDSMETVGKNKRHIDATIQELDRSNVRYEVRRLNIGDFLWIARDKQGNELVLPYIVERKRLDDLAGSIKSGRYQEQKFRLKNSGIPNVTYLIEFLDVKNYGLPIQTLYKAVVNSEVQHDCQIKFTDSGKDTILYLAVHTSLLSEIYSKKLLCSCAKDQLPPEDMGDDMVSLMHFAEFNQAASKYGAVNVKDFFVRQLIQLAQMTVEKAIAITNVYPTPRALLAAYEDGQVAGTDEMKQTMLAKIPYGTAKRTIGAALSKVIFDFYHKQTPS